MNILPVMFIYICNILADSEILVVYLLGKQLYKFSYCFDYMGSYFRLKFAYPIELKLWVM